MKDHQAVDARVRAGRTGCVVLLLALIGISGCTRHHQVAPDVWIVDEPTRASTAYPGVWSTPATAWWPYGYGIFPPYRIGYGYGATGFPYWDLYYPWYGWRPSYVWGYPQHPWIYDRWWFPYRFPPAPVHPDGPPANPGSVAFMPPLPALPDPAEPPPDPPRIVAPAVPGIPEVGFDVGVNTPPPVFQRRIVNPRGIDDGSTMIVRSPAAAKLGPSRTEPLPRRPVPVNSGASRSLQPAEAGKPRTLKPPRAGTPRTFRPTRPTYRARSPQPRISTPRTIRSKASPGRASRAPRSVNGGER